MAGKEHVYDIDIGTAVDLSGLQEGLSKAEKELIKASLDQIKVIEDAAHEQVKVIRETEEQKIAEVKKSIQEQISALKNTPGLDKAQMQAQVNELRNAENQKIKIIKEGARQAENAIKTGAKNQEKIVSDTTKKMIQKYKEASKGSLQAIKDFAKGAAQELLGIDPLLSAVAGGPVAIGKMVVDIGKKAVTALHEWSMKAAEAAQQQDKLKAVLKSSGAEAWTTASQLSKMASEQSAATGKSKGEITDMQAVLLGFRSVTKDVFGDATKAIIDMSAVMGGDLRGAANMLGKALDTPVQGMSALSRVGFVFTEQQKEMIKTLEAAGKHEEAQRVILGEVQAAFSGASTATNEAMRAQIAYNNAINSFEIAVGEAVSGSFTGIKQFFADVLTKMTETIEKHNEYNRALEFMNNLSATATVAINKEQAAIDKLKQSMEGASAGEITAINEQIKKREENIQTIMKDDMERRKNSEQNITLLEEEIAKLDEMSKSTGDKMIEGAKKSGTTALLAVIPCIGGIVSGIKGTHDAIKDVAKMKEWHDIEKNLKEQGKTIEGRREEIEKEIEAIRENIKLHGEESKELDKSTQIEADKVTFADDFNDKMKEQIALIIKQAELNGLDINGQEVKKQILDAQLSTYQQMLQAAGKLADGSYKFNDAVEATIQAQRRSYEASKVNNSAWKKSLDDIIAKQKQLREEFKKLYEDTVDRVRRLDEENEERKHQKRLATLMTIDRKRALDYVADYNEKKQNDEYENTKKNIQKSVKDRLDALDELKRRNPSSMTRRAYLDKRLEYEKEGQEALENLEREFAGRKIIIYEDLDQELVKLDEETYNQRAEKLNEATANGAEAFDKQKTLLAEAQANRLASNEAMWQKEREQYAEGSQEREDIDAQYYAQRKQMEDEYIEYVNNAEKQLLQKQVENLQEFLNATNTIVNNISTAWKNCIDYELEEKLRANDLMEQSDEERAAKKEELEKEAAKERYKADMVAWSANVIMAYANAALAVLTAYAQHGIAGAVLAGVVGATQVAAVMSAQPKPPRFHEGGLVQGKGEVPAILKEGEVVSTQKQFSDIMKAFSNVANVGTKTGNGGLSLNVNVENQVSNAKVETSLDAEGLKIIVREAVNGMMSNGELDRGFNGKELHDQGMAIV